MPSIAVKNSEVIAIKKNHFFAIASQAMKKSDNFVTDYLLAEASSISKEMINEIGNRQMEWRDAVTRLSSLLNQLCKFSHKYLKFYPQILSKNEPWLHSNFGWA